ncbi:MAG: fasciclin domain-containing protein [Saprospiraceae bacterium]
MKQLFLLAFIVLTAFGCQNSKSAATTEASSSGGETQLTGQSGVKDDVSNPNIVQVAVQSKDHTTLVAAVKAAGLVDALSNAGPFTVFAPTNAAFDKLPAGTVEGLLKPEKKDALTDILGYHTYVGVLKTSYLSDGQKFEQVNGGYVTIGKKDGKVTVNGSEIVASIPTSNGIIHVINDVLLPPSK